MIATIEIVREAVDMEPERYRARSQGQQVAAETPGQALDKLEALLVAQGTAAQQNTIVLVQRFQPDTFFDAKQQAVLSLRMEGFQNAVANGQLFDEQEQQQLEEAVDAELRGAIARANSIFEAAWAASK